MTLVLSSFSCFNCDSLFFILAWLLPAPFSADKVNDSPIEQASLTVSTTDKVNDSPIPCLTYRTWVLAITSCAPLAFLNHFSLIAKMHPTSFLFQLVLPIGKFMAATLPGKIIAIPRTEWSFHWIQDPSTWKSTPWSLFLTIQVQPMFTQ